MSKESKNISTIRTLNMLLNEITVRGRQVNNTISYKVRPIRLLVLLKKAIPKGFSSTTNKPDA